MSDEADSTSGPATASCSLTAKSQHNQNVPLLKLPAELRNQIHRYIFEGHIVSVPQYRIGNVRMLVYRKEDYLKERAAPVLQLFAITETCRQLYYDTYLLPFEMLDLRIEVHHEIVFKAAEKFLDCLSDNRRAAIATIHVSSALYIEHVDGIRAAAMKGPFLFGACRKFSDSDERLSTLLGRLHGLKSMLVLGEGYSGSFTARKESEKPVRGRKLTKDESVFLNH